MTISNALTQNPTLMIQSALPNRSLRSIYPPLCEYP